MRPEKSVEDLAVEAEVVQGIDVGALVGVHGAQRGSRNVSDAPLSEQNRGGPRDKGRGMTTRHYGSCLCGAVRFEVEGGFDHFFLCHCAFCRKDTGSAHGANLFSTTAKLTWLSGEAQVITYHLPSTRHAKSFCKTCGSALPRAATNASPLVVPAGSLETPVALRPSAHLFVASRADWDHELETVPMIERLP
jgi:hypothetical protein